MPSTVIKCKRCGAFLKIEDGGQFVECTYCKTANAVNFSRDDTEDLKFKVESLESLLKRGHMYLENGDKYLANIYFDRVLDINPEEPKAYIGKLLAELGLAKEKELRNLNIDLDDYNNFNDALYFANARQKAKYLRYKKLAQRPKRVRKKRTFRVLTIRNMIIGFLILAAVLLILYLLKIYYKNVTAYFIPQ